MQGTKLHSVSLQYCIIQQPMARFLLILLTYANLSLLDSKRRSKNDSEVLIVFSKRLLETIADKQKNPDSHKIERLALSQGHYLSKTQKSIKYQMCSFRYTGIKPTVGSLLGIIGNRAKDHTIAQEFLSIE